MVPSPRLVPLAVIAWEKRVDRLRPWSFDHQLDFRLAKRRSQGSGLIELCLAVLVARHDDRVRSMNYACCIFRSALHISRAVTSSPRPRR
jgi:hypothetical protein